MQFKRQVLYLKSNMIEIEEPLNVS